MHAIELIRMWFTLFQIVGHYIGVKNKLEFLDNAQIHWAGGRTSAPPNRPECGFDGSLCQSELAPVEQYQNFHFFRNEQFFALPTAAGSNLCSNTKYRERLFLFF